MKTFIIGDIHGCAKALERLLIKLRPNEDRDRLILLGDLFDRGPDSFEVFRMAVDLAGMFGENFCLLRGNHEDYLLREKLSFAQRLTWNRVGRQATVRSFHDHGMQMEDTIPWIRDHVKLFYRDDTIQCVHAGCMVEPIEANTENTLIHDHSVGRANRYSGRLTVTGHIALEAPTWFAGDGKTLQMIHRGEWYPLPTQGILCIDTGCGKGGRLTGMVLEDSKDGLHYRLEGVAEE